MEHRKGYGQFCPISQAAEVFAERWTPLVIRELLCGSVRFNDLQRGVPRMSPALLTKRLKELEFAGIVERRQGEKPNSWEYHPTDAGRELMPVLEALGDWAQRWLRHELTVDSNLDPDLLMWDIRRRVTDMGDSPGKRFVVQFQLDGVPANKRFYWLVRSDGVNDLCSKNPGFEVELYVTAHMRVLTHIWLGHETANAASESGRLKLDGDKQHTDGFARWFALSHFAPAGQRPAADRRREYSSDASTT